MIFRVFSEFSSWKGPFDFHDIHGSCFERGQAEEPVENSRTGFAGLRLRFCTSEFPKLCFLISPGTYRESQVFLS